MPKKDYKKKILLIGPHNPNKIRIGQYLSPPLGIYRIASYLENKKLAKVDVVDPTLDYQETIDKLSSRKYNLIGHSVLHPTLKGDLELMWKAHKLSPNSLQIAGGQGAYFNSEEILTKTPIKRIVKGLGESVFEKIIKENFKLEALNDFCIKKGVLDAESIKNFDKNWFKKISMDMDFNKIPYQKYWGFMGSKYNKKHLDAMKNQGMLKTIRLMVSNYCPLGCTHCTSTNFLKGQKVTFLEPEEIVFMMNKSKKSHPDTQAFYFNDDNFLMMGKNKISRLCEIIKKENIKENKMFQGRVDEIGKESLQEMSDAGFRIGFYGVETFSNRLAGGIRKRKGNVDYGNIAKKTIEDTLDVGMMAQFSLMFYLPDSEEKDLETTIENSIDLMGKGAKVTIFPYVEAYSGAKIIDNHELTYKEFEIEGNHFRISDLVLPNEKNIRKLAKESLILREKLNKEKRWKKYGGKVPQPVDSLNLFKATYKILGKSVSKIEKMLKSY
ncbi:hypothetical protein KAJ87_03480 [Candidatus Pacearchaeota archaeon]|nr:hypothetical protein [Candidatus Pacearchaeota archaeon]